MHLSRAAGRGAPAGGRRQDAAQEHLHPRHGKDRPTGPTRNRRVHVAPGALAAGADRHGRLAAGAEGLRLPQRGGDRRDHGIDGQEGPRDADGCLHDPPEERRSLLEHLQQRADALHAAPDLVGRRAPRGPAARLPGVPRLCAHALRVRPEALPRDEDRADRRRLRREAIPRHGRAPRSRHAGRPGGRAGQRACRRQGGLLASGGSAGGAGDDPGDQRGPTNPRVPLRRRDRPRDVRSRRSEPDHHALRPDHARADRAGPDFAEHRHTRPPMARRLR